MEEKAPVEAEVLSTGVNGKHECPLWEKAAAGKSAAHSETEEGFQGTNPPNKSSSTGTSTQGTPGKEHPREAPGNTFPRAQAFWETQPGKQAFHIHSDCLRRGVPGEICN